MRKMNFVKLLSLLLCYVLIAAVALFTLGCGSGKVPDFDETVIANAESVGVGENEFVLTVTFDDESTKAYCVSTDEKTVGAALQKLGIVSGEAGPYGLFIKSVCGVSAVYETDGKYWAFYVDGEYALSGIDTTEIADGVIYSLKVE